MYTPHNILVTGGCGFIGSNFINYLHDTHSSVTIVNYDKLILNSNVQNVRDDVRASSRYHLVTGDIRNRPLVEHTLDTFQVSIDCPTIIERRSCVVRLTQLSTSPPTVHRPIVTATRYRRVTITSHHSCTLWKCVGRRICVCVRDV
jgi:nucleoside-diphosphate-sugar epimerase